MIPGVSKESMNGVKYCYSVWSIVAAKWSIGMVLTTTLNQEYIYIKQQIIMIV